MRSTDRRRLDRMLGGGESISPQEKEQILAAVLRRCQNSNGPGFKLSAPTPMRLLAFGAVLSGFAAVAAVLLPQVSSSLQGPQGPDTLEVRGGDRTHGSFRMLCWRQGSGAVEPPTGAVCRCHLGDTLLFDLQPPAEAPFFSAGALDASGTLVWYLLSEDSVHSQTQEAATQSSGVVLGDEHRPGTHRVLGLFSHEPLPADDVRSAFEAYLQGSRHGGEGVLEEQLMVQP